jgi:hypothetical protein
MRESIIAPFHKRHMSSWIWSPTTSEDILHRIDGSETTPSMSKNMIGCQLARWITARTINGSIVNCWVLSWTFEKKGLERATLISIARLHRQHEHWCAREQTGNPWVRHPGVITGSSRFYQDKRYVFDVLGRMSHRLCMPMTRANLLLLLPVDM